MAHGFQTQVTNQPAPALAGDRASMNPFFSVMAGPGGLVAGAGGAIVGRFAWATAPVDGDGFPSQVNNFGAGPVTGFLPREQQGLITTFLADASMQVPQGFMVTLAAGGDFWVQNDGSAQAFPGMKAYANLGDGRVQFGATGAPLAGGTSTASTIAAQTATITASLVNATLNVTAASGAPLVPGAQMATGAGVAAGTKIVSQISGTPGGIGVYAVSIPEQNVPSEPMTFNYGLLTVGGTVTGSYGVGSVLTGGGTTAGTVITSLGTGAGGAGTYNVSPSQTVASGAINVAATNVETKWYCMSSALPGELCKISSMPLG